MAYLGNPARTKEVINKYHLNAQKKFGQNFLIDDGVLEDIVSSAGITKDDTVLEIGPGIGTLTQYLAEAAGQVIAVEIDDKLLPVLEDTLSEYDNAQVLNADILEVDIKSLSEEKNNGKPFKVVANLPYYITTPIIMKLLEEGSPVESITVMVQKEVADRMQEKEGSKEYGALSIAVQYYADPEVVCVVPPSSFIPQPGVDSAVIKMTRYEQMPVVVEDEKFFFQVVKAAFSQRRKTLVNGLSNNKELGISKDMAGDALEKIGRTRTERGEKLSLKEFAQLSDILYGFTRKD
ncbi:16S rRNA (adenine1518-N6/adenine1519-N6)-dimethyltransferase [Butyrivibrio fibrisolvens DSM 3071]|uniref:Ribosomal RNA small subunit methyltransferase A n=1 Tax=Butyrivibrio fibrisolvens DSM 3071 TaxID=1121131 RepID=A0A1M5ZP17_BUTFI|nr:16S rRNA (adenine(1518)-N(6)/adenine(1519)-N(6))-dimethyltransferase RsmA [Butyrivibrio fibrisolvens]SHI25970.1 16S rRNA (adenine1518-N6/adenine1519-N6)-dimethyltransferase [Butyrivibrio fibrisolvens DSM 3071]